MKLDRRMATALLAAGALPSKLARAQGGPFFTGEEREFLEDIADRILPGDEHSGGAKAAGCVEFIDRLAANSPARIQERWRKLLPQVIKEDRAALLERGAAEEGAPKTPAGMLFQVMKTMTVFAYYTSELGVRQELEYKGGHVMGAFPGCKA